MGEWKTVAFHDLAAPGRTSFVVGPFGSSITKENYVPHGVPVVRGINLARGIFVDDDFVYISDEKADELASANLNPGDLVFTHRGTIGQVSMIPRSPTFKRYVLSSSQVKARLDVARAVPEFYYYWFRSPVGQRILLMNSSTVGVPGIASPLATVKSLQVPHPPLNEQRAIAAVLGALDDKVEINDKIARIATELAMTYGRRAISRLDGDETSLADHAEIIKGASYRSADLTEGGGWLVTLKCVGRNGNFQATGMKPYAGECKDSQVVEVGDIVIAQTDLTQKAEVIGRPVRVADGGQRGRLVASLDLAIVRPRETLTQEFIFALLSSQDFCDHAMSYCNGTTVLHMGARALPDFRFVLPDSVTVKNTTAIMSPLLARADQVKAENRTLAELRDTLLPKLMSGELRVRDAEKVVEEAT